MRAIDWCLEHKIDVINLSLGTLNAEHRGAFEDAIARTQKAGAVIVSALEINGQAALPGSLAGVIGVAEASTDEYEGFERYGKVVFAAPPFPRDIPGVPRERNLRGVSFAVARISARVAQAWYAEEKKWADRSPISTEYIRNFILGGTRDNESQGIHDDRVGVGSLVSEPTRNLPLDHLGTVSDPSGQMVVGATATLTNLGTAATTTAKTDKEGTYSFLNVEPGTYSMSVSADGFQQKEYSGLVLQSRDTQTH